MKEKILNLLIKKAFGGHDIDNPLPYYFKYLSGDEAKKCQDSRINARVNYFPLLSIPIPVYSLYGEKYISARALAGIIGSCPHWKDHQEWQDYRLSLDTRLKKALVEEGHDLSLSEYKEAFHTFMATFVAAYTPQNRVPTYSVFRNLINHITTYALHTGTGCLKINKMIKSDAIKFLSETMDLTNLSEIDRHFLDLDYRAGSFLLTKKACLDLAQKYVNYNYKDTPWVYTLAEHKLNFLMGKERKFKSNKSYQCTIQYDLKYLRDLLEKMNPQLTLTPDNVHFFVQGMILGGVNTSPGFKGLIFDSNCISDETNSSEEVDIMSDARLIDALSSETDNSEGK